jgi:hypothetical protein
VIHDGASVTPTITGRLPLRMKSTHGHLTRVACAAARASSRIRGSGSSTAPSAYNLSELPADLPASPLVPPERITGFRWASRRKSMVATSGAASTARALSRPSTGVSSASPRIV